MKEQILEKVLEKILPHLETLDDHYYGEITVKFRNGIAVLITKEQTVRLDVEEPS